MTSSGLSSVVSLKGRRLVILADGQLDFHFGKTAIGILRYRNEDVVAVIDASNTGRTAQQALGLGGDVPIVASMPEALRYQPNALLIGLATRGGYLPNPWRPILLEAIEHGLDIISGLHFFLSEDPELRAAAERAHVQLVDVRRPPDMLQVASGEPHRATSTVVTTVGSDCAVGKMSVVFDLEQAALTRGVDAAVVATGQTGMLIAGSGVPLDRVIGDFMAGAVERLVLEGAARHDVVLVEGQGSLLHPAYSGVTLALLHGSQPDAMILVIMPTRHTIEDYPIAIPPLQELIAMHEAAAGWVKPAPVIGIAVNGLGLSAEEAEREVRLAEDESGLPAADTFRQGAGRLLDAILTFRNNQTLTQNL